MPYDLDRHRRRSMRLQGYDYTQAGLYFVTVCVQDRLRLFGDISDGVMRQNDAGRMVLRWWDELLNAFPDIDLDSFALMPNHVRGIIMLGTRPDDWDQSPVRPASHAKDAGHHQPPDGRTGASLSTTIQWFKTMTTNAYIRGVKQDGWPPFNKRLWQRNYYDHIIRNDRALERLRNYVAGNPGRWLEDSLHPDNPSDW